MFFRRVADLKNEVLSPWITSRRGVTNPFAILANCIQRDLGMKTLLHHKKKHLYFKGLSEWTNDMDAAFDFGVIERAVKFVGMRSSLGIKWN